MASRRSSIYVILAIVLTAGYIILDDAEWRSSAHFHFDMEIVAAVLAAAVGAMALVRYYSRNNNTFLFIGTGFLGTALLDAYHGIVVSESIAPYLPSDLISLMPWSWIASRQFLSVMLFLGWLFWLREQRLGSAGRIRERTIYLISATLTAASLLFIALVPLPGAYYPELFFSRPEDLAPALLFLITLIGYLRKGQWRHDAIDHWVVLALIAGLVGQVVFMSHSARMFDARCDAAHILKLVSYICVFVGLAISMFQTLRGAEARTDQLTGINEELQIMIAERAQAEQALRDSEQNLRAIVDHSPALIYMKDTSSRLLMFNQASEKFFGVTEEEALGSSGSDWLRTENLQKLFDQDRKVVLNKQPQLHEFECLDAEGEYHCMRSVKFPVLDNNDTVTAIGGLSMDVTDQKRTEADLRKYSAEMELLRRATVAANDLYSADDAIKATLEQVCRHIGWSVGHAYIESGRSSAEMVSSGLWYLSDPERFAEFRRITEANRFTEGVGLPGRVLAGGEPIWIEDINKDADFSRAASDKEIEVRAGFAFPVFVGRQTVAILEFFSDRPEKRDESLLRLVMQIGAQLGRAIERKRHQEELEASITEIDLVAKRLRESEENLLNMTANVPGIVYQQVLHPDGHMTYPFISEGIREICGIEAEQIKSDPSLFLGQIHADDQKRYTDAIRQSARSLTPLSLELRFRLSSGQELWLHDNSRPRRGGYRTIVRDAIMFDITDRKRMEAELVRTQAELQAHLMELEKSRDRLEMQSAQLLETAQALTVARDHAEQANIAKSQFLANASHELRTPLNAVIGLSAILNADAFENLGEAECREYLTDIHDAGQQLLNLVNDILDLSKVESGHFQLEVIEFDILDVIEIVPKTMKPKMVAKNIDLWSFLLPGTPRRVMGDPARLRQILLNLADNALKYTNEGVVVIEASLESEDESGLLYRFKVTDTGIGISKNIQPKLFSSFSQADASTTRKFGGTGLGLAICKQFATLMGGEIGVESEVGKGSTFWFTARFGRSLSDARTDKPATDLKDLRVLVVEQTDSSREILRRQIESWGMSAILAPDEPAAMAALETAAETASRVDVVLISHRTPETGCNAFAAGIRGMPEMSETRIVLVRSVGSAPSPADADAAPYDAVLDKPVVQSDLFDCLANLFDDGIPLAPDEGGATARPIDEESRKQRGCLRILVAEDNHVNAKVAVKILSRAEHLVDVVDNGADAVDAVSAHGYDLILMDIQMPVMDGVEAAKRIRALQGDTAHTPIIALTAHAMKGDRERYLAVGMDDYVSKPIDPGDLAVAIERQTGVKTTLEAYLPVKPAAAEKMPEDAQASFHALLHDIDEMRGV